MQGWKEVSDPAAWVGHAAHHESRLGYGEGVTNRGQLC